MPLSIGDAQRPATPAHEGRAEVPTLPAVVAASSVAAHTAASVAAATVPVTVAESTSASEVPLLLTNVLLVPQPQNPRQRQPSR